MAMRCLWIERLDSAFSRSRSSELLSTLHWSSGLGILFSGACVAVHAALSTRMDDRIAPCPSRNVVHRPGQSSDPTFRTQESENSLPRLPDGRPLQTHDPAGGLPAVPIELGCDPQVDVGAGKSGERRHDDLFEQAGHRGLVRPVGGEGRRSVALQDQACVGGSLLAPRATSSLARNVDRCFLHLLHEQALQAALRRPCTSIPAKPGPRLPATPRSSRRRCDTTCA
jgi:hypothetical protein